MSTSSVTGTTANTFTSATGSSSKITGLVSGLDTTSIINAIMQAAAQPQTNLKNQLSNEQAKLVAYQAVNGGMAMLQTAADALNSPTTWQAMTVASSSSSVAATASAGALAGSVTFDVTQLASGQSSVFANTVSSTSTPVVTSGTPVTLTVGTGSPITINTGDGSLAGVAAGINAAKAGVQASIVQVGTSSYRLQVSSTTTGSGATFAVSGLDATLGATNNIANAQDAQITVGAGMPGAYTVSSSSNTFSQAIPGLTFTVSQQTTGVTLTTAPDSSGISAKVQTMVDAANSVLSMISTDTAYDTSTNTGSVLTGDSTMRELSDSIMNSISAALGNGTSATTVGLSVTKDGLLSFDATAFQTAFTADPSAVQAAFGPTGTYTPPSGSSLTGGITLQKSSDATAGGTYDVTVTQAATTASGSINTSSGLVAGQTITLGSQGNTATYTVQSTDTVSSVISALNTMSAQNNLSVNAVLDSDGSTIDLTSGGYGSEYTFTSSATGGLTASAVTAGLDVAGTINGQTAKGVGQLLYTLPGTQDVDAITLNVTLTTADVAALGGGTAGTFTFAQGASQKLADVANGAVSATTGTLTNEISSENTTISDLTTQISNWQVVLDTKQAALEQQWANLESQLSNLQAQGNQLSAAILAMTGQSSSSKK